MQLHWPDFGHFPWTEVSLVAWLLIALALFFDFLNGFHDAANSVATVVSTRVLSPGAAIVWAAFFNFIAFLIFPLSVSTSIAKDQVDPDMIRGAIYSVLGAALIAACLWNLLTWYLALPTSSSHALIGSMVGAALAMTGSMDVLRWGGLLKTIAFIFLSPLLGMFLGLLTGVAVLWLFHRVTPRRVDMVFRKGQLISAAWFSLNHGGNDAQKTMGIIFLLLSVGTTRGGAGNPVQIVHHGEVVLACHLMIALGTLFGGWRIVKTMGQRILRLRPMEGFCAETGAGVAVAIATSLGTPVSTTHTVTGSIVGVGALRRLSAVRWGIAGQVVWAWILTIPGSALMAAVCWYVIHICFG
jgi:PiT family inorganic phosphate transporter